MKNKTNAWRDKVNNAEVPKYYKGLLFNASESKPFKTSGELIFYNYSDAGYELARHIAEYVEEKILDRLFQIRDNPELVKNWVKINLNRFYSLVPSNRRDIFLRGFLDCLENGQ